MLPRMPGSSASEDRWHGRRRCLAADDLDEGPEEGELVPEPEGGGYHSDGDTADYFNNCPSIDDSDETISDSDEATTSVPASSADADASPSSSYYAASPASVAASNNNSGGNASAFSAAASSNGNASSSSAAAAATDLACRVCGKVFRSQMAVCGHMKVHALDAHHGRQAQAASGKAVGIIKPVAAGWGVTGKRGYPGSSWARAARSRSAQPERSMAIVLAEPQLVLQPTPLAYAAPSNLPSASAVTNPSGESSSGTQQPPVHNDAMDTDQAGDANPPTEAVVHNQPIAPPHQQQPIAPPPAPAPPVHAQHQPVAPPRAGAGRQNPNGYTCKECHVWFRTHQGLGGHMAGHKNRELAAAASGSGMLQDGTGPCRRNARPERPHVCKVCAKEFPAGVQLGGHMRKHYSGPPIVPNKKPRLLLQTIEPPADSVAEPPPAAATSLTLALPGNADVASPAPAAEAAAQHGPAPAVERTPEPAPVATRVRLFGIDIGLGVQAPTAEEGAPATEGSPAAEGSSSTAGQQ